MSEAGNFEGADILNRIEHRGDLVRPPDVEAAARPPLQPGGPSGSGPASTTRC